MKKPADKMTEVELELEIAELRARGIIRCESPVAKFVGEEGSVQPVTSHSAKSRPTRSERRTRKNRTQLLSSTRDWQLPPGHKRASPPVNLPLFVC